MTHVRIELLVALAGVLLATAGLVLGTAALEVLAVVAGAVGLGMVLERYPWPGD